MREALDLVFDFQWSNKKLFYGLYKRTTSYFENSDMKASGKPSPEELALLEPFKDKLSPEVFGEPYTPPVTDGSGNNRDNLKKARDLLIAAGWTPGPDHMLHNAKGELLTIEFLEFEAMFERITVPYTDNLRRIGVDASFRLIDPAQYERRVKSFDFDVDDPALFASPDTGRRAEKLLGVGGRQNRRIAQPRRHQRSRRRRSDR